MDISIDRLAGQLRYVFEDDPALRSASAEQLAERLNHDDRFARARQKYPLQSDSEIRERVSEFESRITSEHIREALARLDTTSDEDE